MANYPSNRICAIAITYVDIHAINSVISVGVPFMYA